MRIAFFLKAVCAWHGARKCYVTLSLNLHKYLKKQMTKPKPRDSH